MGDRFDVNRVFLALLLVSLVVSAFFLCHRRVGALGPGQESCVDPFYHVMMADWSPGICLSKTFPHTDMSIWKDHFYDKELSFHLLLGTVRKLGGVLGVSPDPPFHFAVMVFVCALLGVMAALLWRLDRGYAWLWLWLFVSVIPAAENRMTLLRPHLLSMALMAAACFLLPRVRRTGRLWIPALLAVLFVYSYSTPHLVFIPAGIWALFLAWRRRFKLAGGVLGVTFLGFLAAMVAHPQFPNTFIVWKAQCVDVLWEMLTKSVNLDIGGEEFRPCWLWLEYNAGLFVLTALELGGAAWLLARRRLSVHSGFLLSCQLVFLAGLCLVSMRFVEYALPLSILASCRLWRDVRRRVLPGAPPLARRLATPALLVLAGVPAALFPLTLLPPGLTFKPFDRFGEWSAKNLVPGTLVANIEWEDFPILFYSAPNCRYLVGLDPMFGYAQAPEAMRKIAALRRMQYPMPPAELRALTGADFAFVNPTHGRLAAALHDRLGYRLVHSDGFYLFDLRPLPPGVKLKRAAQ